MGWALGSTPLLLLCVVLFCALFGWRGQPVFELCVFVVWLVAFPGRVLGLVLDRCG